MTKEKIESPQVLEAFAVADYREGKREYYSGMEISCKEKYYGFFNAHRPLGISNFHDCFSGSNMVRGRYRSQCISYVRDHYEMCVDPASKYSHR